MEFASVDDTTLEGAQIIGDRVIGTVGGDRNIISEQDTETNSRQQSSSGGSLSVGTGSVSGSYNSQTQTGTSDYASVDEQTGIYAGSGGFDITVGGNTHLEGAVIASEAAAENNSLVTGTLTVEDIENKSSYEANTSGWGGEFTYVNNPGQGDKNANTGSISPSLPMSEKGDDRSMTHSAIAEGTIVITDEEAQLAKTGQTAEETIANLDRDTDNAHNGALKRPVELDKLLNEQAELAEASSAAGKAVAQTVGDISQSMLHKTGDKEWGEGGAYKTILQGIGAALVAQLGNGEGLHAALGITLNQLITEKVQELAESLAEIAATDPDAIKFIKNLINNAAATGAGLIIGGETSAQVASLFDRYNRAMHEEQATRLKELYLLFAGNEEMIGNLQAAVAYLTEAGTDLHESDPKREELIALEEKGRLLFESNPEIFELLDHDHIFGKKSYRVSVTLPWIGKTTFYEHEYDEWEKLLSQNGDTVQTVKGGVNVGRGVIGYVGAGFLIVSGAPASGATGGVGGAAFVGVAAIELVDSTDTLTQGIHDLTKKYQSNLGEEILRGIMNAEAIESLQSRYAKELEVIVIGAGKGKIVEKLKPVYQLGISVAEKVYDLFYGKK